MSPFKAVLYTTVPSRDQETSKKQVTDDDVNDAPINEPGAAAVAKPDCKYGTLCFQTNEQHLAQFSHPPRPEEDKKKSAKKKIACKFGAECYQTNAYHREKYSHDAVAPAKAEAKEEDAPIEDVFQFSEEADVPKEVLKRHATLALSVADVQEAVAAAAHNSANNDGNEMVQISVAELNRLQELARQAEELQPKLKRAKSSNPKK